MNKVYSYVKLDDSLKFHTQAHILIAGASGSGKSVLETHIVNNLYFRYNAALLLIDLKRVELIDFKGLDHVAGYADDPMTAERYLQSVLRFMDDRYIEMQQKHIKKYDGIHLYIVIDELADLVIQSNAKKNINALSKIAMLGRAAGIHLIICTQRPTADILDKRIMVNIDCRVALRCGTSQDSRNIIGFAGAEKLPRYGQGLMVSPDFLQPHLFTVPSPDIGSNY